MPNQARVSDWEAEIPVLPGLGLRGAPTSTPTQKRDAAATFARVDAPPPDPERVEQMTALLKALMTARHIKEDAVPNMMIPKLFLGSIGAANNKKWLQDHGVTHILTVARNMKSMFPETFVYKKVDVLDSPGDDLAVHFDDCHDFIKEGMQAGGVLVHCFAGRSRSSTIVISYLMKYHGMGVDEALKHCQARRAVVGPNIGFLMQLRELDRKLASTRPAHKTSTCLPAMLLGVMDTLSRMALWLVAFLRQAWEGLWGKTHKAADGLLDGAEPPWDCPCFLTRNFFLAKTRKHHVFLDRSQFLQEYRDDLAGFSPSEVEGMLAELEEESRRRADAPAESARRRVVIKARYQPACPALFAPLREDFVAAAFSGAAQEASAQLRGSGDESTARAAWVRALEGHGGRMICRGRVAAFPALSEEVCEMLMREVDHFNASDMPKGAVSTMNKQGVLLGELGLYPPLLTPLMRDYVRPVATLLFGDAGGGELDHHRSFVVRYDAGGEGGDVDLAYHWDDAEVTLNVCLGGDFEGGELLFGGMAEDGAGHEPGSQRWPHIHRAGWGVLHRGHQCHEAMPITSGTRYNLVMWCRSSQMRSRRCPSCGQVRGTAA